MIPKSGNRFSDEIMLKNVEMPPQPAPFPDDIRQKPDRITLGQERGRGDHGVSGPPCEENGMKKLWLTGLALGASLVLSGAVAAQDISVGVAGPMSGGEASFGRQMKNGAEQAVADINAAGGVLGRKLKLEIGDDACDPKQARSVGEKFAGMKLPFVAGHYCSSSSIPASEAYAEGGVLQITPASTNPTFTERKLWNTFRVCGRDDQQGAVAGAYIARNFKGKNIAVVHDKTTYGKGLADETKKALNKAGIKEKLYESYNKGDKDFNALVSKLKLNAVDLVYVGGYHQESGLILRQMRDQGVKAVLMAGDALADKEFASITGPAAEGVLFTFGPDPRNKATAKAIVDKFKAKNIDPEGYTLYTYAAFQVWTQAVAKAKSTDAKKVAGILKSSGNYDTVLGKLSFDAKGDITILDYVVYKWDSKGNYAEIPQGKPGS
jgi:branched-chain amino acid transport system substrate-binding protein